MDQEFNFNGVEEREEELVKFNIYVVSNIIYKNYMNTLLQNAITYVKSKEILSIDIETTWKFGGKYPGEGLDPYLSDIVMLQVGDLNRQYIIDTRVIDATPLVEAIKDKKLVGQNIKFEYKHILHKYRIRLNNLYDTMIAEQVLFNGLDYSNSLEALNKRYLGIQVNKSTRLNFLHIKDRAYSNEEIKYGAEDILYPLLIKREQEKGIAKKNLSKCVSLEFQYIPVLGDIEYNGMNFNPTKWIKNYEQNVIKSSIQKEILDSFVIENLHIPFLKSQLDLFSTEAACAIKWTSSKQVIEYFKYLNICPMEKSKTTKRLTYTVEAKVIKASLNTINKEIPEYLKTFIKDYLRFKEIEQSVTTFGYKFLKYVNPVTKRLHSNYRQIINTGRMSSSGPNLQNIPAATEFRSCFDAPENYDIVNADFTGQEQIVLVNKSLDKDLISFYEKKLGDMHSFVASKIYPELKDVSLKDIKIHHKDKRQIAKSAGFAINYGGTGFTIANNLGLPLAEGDAVYDAYFKAFPGLKNFFDEQIKLSMDRGYIHIDEFTNRKFFFKNFEKLEEYKRKGDKRNYSYWKGKFERACLNYIIQGAAGSITKFAGILFRRWLLENNLTDKVKLTNIIHDELNVESPKELSKAVAEALERTMKVAGSRWCTVVPLGADAAITDHWSH